MGTAEPPGPGEVTEVLAQLQQGAPEARDELFRMVYAELHRLAQAHMRPQPSGHTLQPTALVHEAYLRLMGGPEAPWQQRAHFFNAAARAMRSILVDHARARSAKKRGGGRRRIPFDEEAHAATHTTDEVLAVHEALERMEAVNPQGSRVVELRFFGGLSVEEVAQVMSVGNTTVYRIWEHARSWLYREIRR